MTTLQLSLASDRGLMLETLATESEGDAGARVADGPHPDQA